ncbi:MAG: GntR family transcriptional regulator [Alphaproteobacteria bacterium]|nr:MAG: GntR family transcriptional regulator [Alphaproteobacteria bacterium]
MDVNDSASGPDGRQKYRRVYQLLRGRLERGDYPVGSALPTEDELCREYGASRYTLREAVRLLERQGFVQKRRRAGTRVLAHEPSNIFRHAAGTRRELLDFISGTTIDFSAPRLIQTDGRLARLLGCDEMRSWHLLEGVRVDAADKRPIGVVQVYVDAERAALQGEVDVGHQAVYKWLESRYDIRATIISQDISAVLLNDEQAKILGEHAGAPSLRIIRRYFDQSQKMFQIAVTVHRSADFVYNTRLLLEN